MIAVIALMFFSACLWWLLRPRSSQTDGPTTKVNKHATTLQNMNLTTVNLRCNRLGDEGTVILCQALELNCSIVTLDLRSNEITENGAELLAKILRRNETLTTLLMGNNKVGDNGAKYLADALHNSIVSVLCRFPVEYSNSILLHIGIEYIGSQRSGALFEESNFVGLSISRRTTSRMFADRLQIQNTQSMNEEDFWLGLYGTNELFSRRLDWS
ncbi:unnamed protein product [Rotaria magnacalcarata]|uniref:Uncharacterized protein n=1 Tax=Rotaria magnacalcarata TaxID=392030 RepID=A0A816DDB1_9BILA|nr:unnamed protein product [Rotaria magnacalcarata]